MKKLLIFDLDGTLADTLPSIQHAMELSMEHYGFKIPTLAETEAALGSGARQLLKNLVPADVAKDEAKIDEFLAYYNEMYSKTYMEVECCYEGMAESVSELKKRGYTIAVLSNKQDNYVVDLCKKLIKEGVISIARGQTELPTKPDPTVPHMIMNELGFKPSETVFIGDSDVDILTAVNSGFESVACSWGFRRRPQLEVLKPNHIIDKPVEILDIFN